MIDAHGDEEKITKWHLENELSVKETVQDEADEISREVLSEELRTLKREISDF